MYLAWYIVVRLQVFVYNVGTCVLCKYMRTYMVEHFKQLGTGLVDSTDDGPPALSQGLEQGDALETGRAV